MGEREEGICVLGEIVVVNRALRMLMSVNRDLVLMGFGI